MSITTKSIARGLAKESRASKVDYGEVYGYLTVRGLDDEALAATQAFGQRVWVCKCRCGNWIKVKAVRIVYGNRKSCGCKAVNAAEAQIKRYQYRKSVALERMPDPAESAKLAARFGG